MNENRQKILELAKKKDLNSLSYREIGREVGIKNPQTVIYHLEQLRKKGLIYFDPKKKSTQTASGDSFVINELFNLPILGMANCGQALELAQQDVLGYIKISPKLLPKKKSPEGLFIVKAVGKSLNKASINGKSIKDGDYVVIDAHLQPRDGDYVLSVIDGAANIKRFYHDRVNREIRLVSESTLKIPPIVLHEDDIHTTGYAINGVAVKVIRK
ncbi:MAG: winged helix-turn-helix transcriptional regulator [Candidatus Pacebacteria bacterium]|nr:winged helix-turn-helix transcriptional regulator [Candidatus Paceibacterota bacterium]